MVILDTISTEMSLIHKDFTFSFFFGGAGDQTEQVL
jgi:hypothetical protein